MHADICEWASRATYGGALLASPLAAARTLDQLEGVSPTEVRILLVQSAQRRKQSRIYILFGPFHEFLYVNPRGLPVALVK